MTLKMVLWGSYSEVLVLPLQQICQGLCHLTRSLCVPVGVRRSQAIKASLFLVFKGTQALVNGPQPWPAPVTRTQQTTSA